MLTDFHNSFAGALSENLQQTDVQIFHHTFQYVATLPYEISMLKK